MTTCLRDEDGNVICYDDYLYPENPEECIKDDWYKNQEEVYIAIIKENTKYYNDYVQGKF